MLITPVTGESKNACIACGNLSIFSATCAPDKLPIPVPALPIAADSGLSTDKVCNPRKTAKAVNPAGKASYPSLRT